MTRSIWQRLSRDAEIAADVAVVGGGIIGCATAYWLRKLAPSLKVVIVEAGQLGEGATGRNAGFLLQGTSTDYLSDILRYGRTRARQLGHFTHENRDLIFSELRRRVISLEESGSLTVAGTPEEDVRLQKSVSLMRSDGFPVAYIPPRDTNQRITAKGFFGSLYVPSGAMLNSVALVRHLAEESGAQILTHHRVLGLLPQRESVVLDTTVRYVRAGRAVLALNAYLPQLVPSLAQYVKPIRAQMLATSPMTPRWLQVPVYSHEGYYYLRQQRNGTLLLGGARHLHTAEEVGYEDTVTTALQADLEAYLHAYFPQTEALNVLYRWSGIMGFSPDHLPTLGEVPDVPGSLWAAGFTGHGMGYGFRFGRLMAEHLLGKSSRAEVALFSTSRFTETITRETPVPA